MLRKVSPGIFRIESSLGARRLAQWVAIGSEGALLFDTGVAGTLTARVMSALKELGIAAAGVVAVVTSHADVDHYGGNAEARAAFPGARLRAHALDRPLIESWQQIAAQRYGWYRNHGLDYPAPTWDWLRKSAGEQTPLDGSVRDGERIDLGGLSLEVAHLPGHSAGHVGLIEPVSGTALIADAAMGRGFDDLDGRLIAPPPYVDVQAYRATIARLQALAPARLETAHFPSMEGPQAARFLDRGALFAEELEEALAQALGAQPLTLAQLTERCDAALGPYPEMPVELSRSVGAHIEALETAGQIIREPGSAGFTQPAPGC